MTGDTDATLPSQHLWDGIDAFPGDVDESDILAQPLLRDLDDLDTVPRWVARFVLRDLRELRAICEAAGIELDVSPCRECNRETVCLPEGLLPICVDCRRAE